MTEKVSALVLPLSEIDRKDIAVVGGKNASLGEMIRNLRDAGIRVPEGFATTADAYRLFLRENKIEDTIASEIKQLQPDHKNLAHVGEAIRTIILESKLPESLVASVTAEYQGMRKSGRGLGPSVAVRSSATAEDLPEASFAGQLETYLNVRGEDRLLAAIKNCFASLFTDRAISYRENNHFDHMDVALSVAVQRMIRSDKAAAGVMFSIDTEAGFPDVVVINAAWGLGETVVQGSVDPDEYHVFKPLLSDRKFSPIVERKRGAKASKMIYARGASGSTKRSRTTKREQQSFVLPDHEVLQLARWAREIEKHYGCPMDMEWAKDGESGELFIVQARPETVQSQRHTGELRSFRLKERGRRVVTGLAIGSGIAAGKVCKLRNADELDQFESGAVLVTSATDPDWVPIMKRAAAIVTDHGGRTSHAAIVSRELGLTAIVGSHNATNVIEDGQEITVSCAEGDEGHVYDGILDFDVTAISLDHIPDTRTDIMINMGNPAAAYRWWMLPAKGVGLARMEFIIGNLIQIHPMALAQYDKVEDKKALRQIDRLTAGYSDRQEYFIDKLATGISRIAAPYFPNSVIVRLSDFKTNEYAQLIGGTAFEPKEDNPMIGFRGASRYYAEVYRDGFAMECAAVKRAREEIGLDNIAVMIPFCRTLEEADRVLEEMGNCGLVRGRNGLKIFVMCEIPSNVFLARDFAERFDGFSIGSNDLTQLVLGIDRDSEILSNLFDEQNRAVKVAISTFLAALKGTGAKTGLCGQAPSDRPEFAQFLVENEIDSISVSPDSFLAVKENVASAEGLN